MDSFVYYLRKVAAMAAVIIAAIASASCDAIYDDLPPCQSGLSLRFIYDYNMEEANAFTSQVECLTVIVYTTRGEYMGQYRAGRPETADEDWRMIVNLPPGSYRVVVWSGVDCPDASFVLSGNTVVTPMDALEVELPASRVGSDLHPLFYGTIEAEVAEPSSGYTEATVNLIKDTNDLRVILASATGTSLDASDFNFTITDDNTRLDYLNAIVPCGTTAYTPWATGSSAIGEAPDSTAVEAAWADFSLSRLTAGSRARLNISRATDGSPVVSVPLIDILLLLKSSRFDHMGPQEFLDRESRWNLTFFLTGGQAWTGVSVVINGWVVRLNDISDLT